MQADSAKFEKVDRGQLWPAWRTSWALLPTEEGGGAPDSQVDRGQLFHLRVTIRSDR